MVLSWNEEKSIVDIPRRERTSDLIIFLPILPMLTRLLIDFYFTWTFKMEENDANPI